MNLKEPNKNLVNFLQRNYVTLTSEIALALIPICIYSVIQLIRIGNKENYLLLLLGSVFSILAIMGYIITSLNYGVKKQKSYLAMLLTFAGFIPWLFGSYLVFIRGFWYLKNLTNGFSLLIIIKSLIFIILGYILISKFSHITEIDKKLKEGTFEI